MSSGKVNFTPVTDIDPNVWYHLTEFRVDEYGKAFTSNFHINGDGELRVFGILEKQTWQFHPIDRDAHPGRYSLRHNFIGVYKQLAVCYDPKEASVGKTKPCLLDSVPGEQTQMWDIADWGDGMVRFINVGNGTDYWLDVHQGNPPFMSRDTDTNADNPAQRWLYTSVSHVNDKAYSTVFSAEGSKPSTPKPSETSSTPPSQETGQGSSNTDASESDSSGLSPAATAGIGASVGLAIVALSLLIFWLCRRRRRDKSRASELPSTSNGHPASPEKLTSPAWSPDQHQQQQQQQQAYFQQSSMGQYDPHQPQVHSQQLGGRERPHEMSTEPQPQEMASVRY